MKSTSAILANNPQIENPKSSNISHTTANLQKAQAIRAYWQKVRQEKTHAGKYTATTWEEINRCAAVAERTVASLSGIGHKSVPKSVSTN